MISRRTFFRVTASGTVAAWLGGQARPSFAAALPGGTLDATTIPQFVTALPIPGVMPRKRRIGEGTGRIDYYEIAVRQFAQQILPEPLPPTVVWGYGPVEQAGQPGVFASPSLTIEATHGVPVRVAWINELVDAHGRYLPHLLPVDPTLTWANPQQRPDAEGRTTTDSRPDFTGLHYVSPADFTDPATEYTSYGGPVPLVTHVQGATGVGDESNGYPEAWYLPDAVDLPAGWARRGRWYDFLHAQALARFGVRWDAGRAVVQYPNQGRASIQWFHDQTLGLARLNTYAGPCGLLLLRGGSQGDQTAVDARTGKQAIFPDPAPRGTGEQVGIRDVPLIIQDRSFNADGSLFYPDTRAFFDGVRGPFVPGSPVPPVWTPEFFANTIMVNGATWPYLEVEKRRYRFRVLNACGSRVLGLDFGRIAGIRVCQIGNDGGFLPAPRQVPPDQGGLVLAPGERVDLIVDFTGVEPGEHVLGNVGPDGPYRGCVPGEDVEVADPATTGRVLQFRVVPAIGQDHTTPAEYLILPPPTPTPDARLIRRLALLRQVHEFDDDRVTGRPPVATMLGVLEGDRPRALGWGEAVTENPEPGTTEIWELYNFTVDGHPVQVDAAVFEVVNRQEVVRDDVTGVIEFGEVHEPRGGEEGVKDTVIAEPCRVTRIKVTFTTAGQYLWRCSLLEHGDNEMMRPLRIGPEQPGQPPDGVRRYR